MALTAKSTAAGRARMVSRRPTGVSAVSAGPASASAAFSETVTGSWSATRCASLRPAGPYHVRPLFGPGKERANGVWFEKARVGRGHIARSTDGHAAAAPPTRLAVAPLFPPP